MSLKENRHKKLLAVTSVTPALGFCSYIYPHQGVKLVSKVPERRRTLAAWRFLVAFRTFWYITKFTKAP